MKKVTPLSLRRPGNHELARILNDQATALSFSLAPIDNARLALLCGEFHSHIKQIESFLNVEITHHGADFSISGESRPVHNAERTLHELYAVTAEQPKLDAQIVHQVLSRISSDESKGGESVTLKLRTPKKQLRPQNPRQAQYVESILTSDLNFGIGPAGTGKTYLAVACAVQALSENEVQRIVLTRPAVEAGERLGFLPGDIGQKVDPYLRPLYDALYEFLGFEKVGRLLERGVIELAPLAYMRGRTLSDAFVILDEAQNTTTQQMKMFLTRFGFGSKVVVTGDVTQIDLPPGTLSGLKHAAEVLGDVDGIQMTWFQAADVIRHPLVQSIVSAYAAYTKGAIQNKNQDD